MASPKIASDWTDYLLNTVGLSDVYVGSMPPRPINAYAVVEYPSVPNVKTHGGGQPQLDNGSLQFQARHQKEQTALNNIHTIVDALDGLKDTTINGVVYLYVSEISRPRIIERDEDNSVTYIWEARVQARRG